MSGLLDICGMSEQSPMWDIGAAVAATAETDHHEVDDDGEVDAGLVFGDVGSQPDGACPSITEQAASAPVLGDGWVSLPATAKTARPSPSPAAASPVAGTQRAQSRTLPRQAEQPQLALPPVERVGGATPGLKPAVTTPLPQLTTGLAKFPVQLYDRSKMSAWSIRRALIKGTALPTFFVQVCTKHTGVAADWQNKEFVHSFSLSLVETLRLSAFLLNPERVEVIFSYHDHKSLRLTRGNGAMFFALQYRNGGVSASSQIHAPPEHQFLLIAMARQMISELRLQLWPDVDIRQVYADLARTI